MDDEEQTNSYQNHLDDIVHDEAVSNMIQKILTSPIISDNSVQPEEKGLAPPREISVDIPMEDVKEICEKMQREFLSNDALIRINHENIIIVGDMHGQAVHLLRILRTSGPPPSQRYLFLGDYVDRGAQGVIVVLLLFCLRLRYPKHVFLLRGNHEDVNTTLNYGFYDECVMRWKKSFESDSNPNGEKVWYTFVHTFNCMPIAAVIGQKIFCSHGGISPFISSLNDINKIERPAIVPAYGIACDLLWSDPSPAGQMGWSLSHRGISFSYGPKAVDDFCVAHGLTLIIRGHQIFTEMYRYGYVLRHNVRLISIFSALNYENYRNNSCILKVSIKDKIRVEPIIYRCRHYATIAPKDMIFYKDKATIETYRGESHGHQRNRLYSSSSGCGSGSSSTSISGSDEDVRKPEEKNNNNINKRLKSQKRKK